MKKKCKFVGLFVCLAILAVTIPLGVVTKVFNVEDIGKVAFNFSVLLKLIVMSAAVVAFENVVEFLLGISKPENHRARSILTILQSLVRYVAVLVILCWGLAIIGVNVSAIVASVGIVALIIGFSAESLIADVVTGAFMLFENQYNVGDIVEVDGFRGVVSNIGIRTTCITDPGDNVKIINNSAMRNILNRSNKLSRSISDISISYGTDLEKLEVQIPALLQGIYENHSDVMEDVPQYLGVQELADSAVVLRFVVNVSEKEIFNCARILNRDLLLGFRKLGVEIPFPQLDVHTDR